MAEKILLGKPNDSLLLNKTELTSTNSNENEGDIKVSRGKAWDEFILALAETHGHALSKMQLRMYRAAVSHLTDDELTRGANWLLRNANFFPNPAECVQACTGIRGGSTAIGTATAISAEVNRLYRWMITWLTWLIEGHRFTLTLGAYGDDPVTYEFVSGSLIEGLETVADHKLRPLRLELRKAQARLQAYEHVELSRVEERITREEVPNSERDRIEKRLQYDDIHRWPVGSDRARPLPMSAEGETRIRAQHKQYQDAVAPAKAKVEAAEEERLYSKLRVQMAPEIPTVLGEVLVLLDLTVEEAILRFVKKDPYVKNDFRKRATEVLAGHANHDPYTPPSRQITGAVQPEDEPRLRQGVISIDPNGDVTYYSVEQLRDAQAAGLPIDDTSIEDQEAFIANAEEIWCARYVPPPPPSRVFTLLTNSSQEDDYEGALVIQAVQEVQQAAQQDQKAAEEKRRESLRKEREEMIARHKK